MSKALLLLVCAAASLTGHHQLTHQRRLCLPPLARSDTLDQPLPVAAAANEAFKQAKAKGYGDSDFAAVYEAIQVDSPPAAAAPATQ